MSPNPLHAGAPPVIRIEGLSFSFGLAPVLQDIDLQVSQGEFVGLVGPNAGGKSTLLKLILGLLEPQTGTGPGPRRVPPGQARRLLGYVPQHPGFPRDFPITVEQVVLMGRLGLGHRLAALAWRLVHADRAAARRALREVQAEDLARRRIGTLSGGQLQRVLVARALVGEPRMLILDEPTANIDQRMEGEIFDLLARAQRPPDHPGGLPRCRLHLRLRDSRGLPQPDPGLPPHRGHRRRT